jgi:hypothetical protein
MNKKGSMELSVNSIVILVIAIVIMGLILGFIRSKFSEVGGNLVTNEPDPQTASSDDRITLSRETISVIPGSQAVLKANIFNPTSYEYTGATPVVTCNGAVPTVVSNSKNIPGNSQISYIISLTIPKSQQRQRSALCTVTTTGTAIDITASCTPVGTACVLTPPTTGTQYTCVGAGCTSAPTCVAGPSGTMPVISTNRATCRVTNAADISAAVQIAPKDFVLQIN